ncbi:MAG: alpha/beta hydrolase [Glaciecola sp.]
MFEQVNDNVPYKLIPTLFYTPALHTFQYGSHSQQFIQFWPAHGAQAEQYKPRPIAVFIHGGCWLSQFSIQHSYPFTTALSQQGFDVYSIEYRRTNNGGEWPLALNDIHAAMTIIRGRIGHNQSVSIIGHSAGGHLAALYSASTDAPSKLNYVGLAPILDIAQYSKGENSCQSATASFMQGTLLTKPIEYEQANAVNKDLEGLLSAYIFTGGNDTIVPIKMATHPQALHINMAQAGHFDWIHPGSTSFAKLVATLYAVNEND